MSIRKPKTAQLIFPNQLFRDTSFLDKDQTVFLVEEFLFFRQYRFHKQKIALHRASMKFYESYLTKRNFRVEYIESTSELSDIRKMTKYLEEEKFEKILITDVCDDWLEKRINQQNWRLRFWKALCSSIQEMILRLILKGMNLIIKPIFTNSKGSHEIF